MPIGGSLLVLGIAAVTCAAPVVVTRLVPAEHRAPQNEVVGFVYAVVGVIYAVILAMVVVGLWNTEDQARTNTYAETDALLQVSWYAHSLPQPARNQIRDLALEYTRTVITAEWPLLADGQASAQAWTQFTRLREDIVTQQPATLADQTRYAQGLDAAAQLGNARRERLDQSADGIPELMWIALVLGGVIAVGFAFMFGMTSLRAHLSVVFSITVLIGSLLLLVYETNHPFTGPLRIQPAAFDLALTRMEAIS